MPMPHAQKRLASTAARAASASRVSFHPLSSKRPAPSSSHVEGTGLEPPATSALSALAHRIGLGSAIGTNELQQACTHSSILSLHAKHHPRTPPPAVNGNLEMLGNSLLGLFAAEHLNTSYPHLPTRVLKAAVSAYVGPMTCASVAREMGAAPLLRWHRTPPTPARPAVLHYDALSSIPRALTALVYQHRSLPTARTFAQSFFLSREVDLRSMLKFRDPKLSLIETVAKFGREKPISRLLKETGRYSISPVFVVGIYSGADKLGEGFGSSLKMAEYRAAEDSLHRLYLTQTPPHLVHLPTSTFPKVQGDVFAGGAEGAYTPNELGETEVQLGSAGRSSIVMPKRPEDVEEEGAPSA